MGCGLPGQTGCDDKGNTVALAPTLSQLSCLGMQCPKAPWKENNDGNTFFSV